MSSPENKFSFLRVLMIFVFIDPSMLIAFSNGIDVNPDSKLEDELREDSDLDQKRVDLRYEKRLVESEVRKRSELWRNILRRSEDFGQDYPQINANDLKSIMKTKGKLTRVSDKIRFLLK